jgi:beta-lactamase class A
MNNAMRTLLMHPLAFFALGALSATGLWTLLGAEPIARESADVAVADEQREIYDEWSFVSPLLLCGYEREEVSTTQLRSVREDVEDILTRARTSDTVSDAGVYVRALNDGGWFGINERAQFTPGSLLKIPLALSVVRMSEHDANFGSGTYTYEGGAPEIHTTFSPEQSVEMGKEYTLSQLLELSLTHSDNIATVMLAQLIDRPTLNAAYSDLGIDVPENGDSYTTSVRTYASFFRILYNGTYLSHRSSQYMLSLLTRSTFTEGMRAGVPEHIPVAHKFGERFRDGELAQLHECGIVYTEQPYILCTMLRGKDIKKLSPVIADISRTVYEGMGKP